MSLIDDQDRALERLHEGRSRAPGDLNHSMLTQKEREEILSIRPNEEAWNELQERILSEIRQGATFSDTWEINGAWVDIKKGAFTKRTFRLNEALPSINDQRILNFFLAHRATIEPTFAQELRRRFFGQDPDLVKGALKQIILEIKRHAV